MLSGGIALPQTLIMGVDFRLRTITAGLFGNRENGKRRPPHRFFLPPNPPLSLLSPKSEGVLIYFGGRKTLKKGTCANSPPLFELYDKGVVVAPIAQKDATSSKSGAPLWHIACGFSRQTETNPTPKPPPLDKGQGLEVRLRRGIRRRRCRLRRHRSPAAAQCCRAGKNKGEMVLTISAGGQAAKQPRFIGVNNRTILKNCLDIALLLPYTPLYDVYWTGEIHYI